MAGYGQFCPIAKAMEVLDERWTVLIVRELLAGSRHFNEIRRGVPRMSSALLSKRLRALARAGILVRHDEGNRVRYELTPGGRELEPVVIALGQWGVRWRSQLGDEDLDPHLLMWDIHRNLDLDLMPPGRTVLAFVFPDVAPRSRRWWIVASPGNGEVPVDLCDFDPGFGAAVEITGTLVDVTRLWRGDVAWRTVVADQRIRIRGDAQACRAVGCWLKLSAFARVPRPVE